MSCIRPEPAETSAACRRMPLDEITCKNASCCSGVLPSSDPSEFASSTNCCAHDAMARTRPRACSGLLTTYRREDLVRALERAGRYRAFSLVRGGAHSGGAGQTAIGDGSADSDARDQLDEIFATGLSGASLHSRISERCWRKRRQTRKPRKNDDEHDQATDCVTAA